MIYITCIKTKRENSMRTQTRTPKEIYDKVKGENGTGRDQERNGKGAGAAEGDNKNNKVYSERRKKRNVEEEWNMEDADREQLCKEERR
jgi:hypothetical protein